MTTRIALAVFALAFGALLGGGARALADDVRYGTYDNRAACEARGADTEAHPGWTRYECRPVSVRGWELYLVG
ncbi:hypothetical protein [Nocardia pseudobrasiliensis]|uniref:Uncharacterized protein n=1 Tax=Nocardia pseudobrasiliensis TaxID=45979 RepID=A0A370IEP0_9NOCA|nr:hypothetical protein [Nocardia pseudobrasiliensis]RDI69185.1 hypothetical protein DFR76_101723 [Nocardia pseudobrasiliensis]